MKKVFPDLPGWSFDIEEVSAGVYIVTGTDGVGRRVEMTGTDVDALLRDVRNVAERYPSVPHGR